MNKFEEWFYSNTNKCTVHKWDHYFNIYDTHMKSFQGKNPTILEIGVNQGGSLEMWNHYFDKKCTIYGVDINADCLKVPATLKADNIHVIIGSQENKDFWDNFKKTSPKFDIIIDDGGHTMNQQIVTYQCMYDMVKENGIYICEDLHTSYWPIFGGGLNNKNSFIEYSKNFIDQLNAYHNGLDLNFRHQTNAIHFYDSVIVLEKKSVPIKFHDIIKYGKQ